MMPTEINAYILAYPNPDPLRTPGIRIPKCQHQVSIEEPCACCDEIDRLNAEAK